MPTNPEQPKVRVTLTAIHSGEEKLTKDVSDVLILYPDENGESQLHSTTTDKHLMLFLLEKAKLSLLLG